MTSYRVSTFDELVNAITSVNAVPNPTDGLPHVIQLAKDITLTGTLPPIQSNVVVEGNGKTIDGKGLFQLFYVKGGTVQFSDLSLVNGQAKGLSQTTAGGTGTAGRGGALYIENGAVTLLSIGFENNRAVGGNGGRNGTGGSAEGGAIYVGDGSVRIVKSDFNNNSATGGTVGVGGVAGSGRGGAVYIDSDATVTIEDEFSGTNNQANEGKDTYGNFNLVESPVVSVFVQTNDVLTADDVVSYTVKFSQAVSNVDSSDFRVITLDDDGDPDNDLTGVSIKDVIAVANRPNEYIVQVNTGSGKGSLYLELVDDDSIVNAGGVPLGGTGAGDNDASPFYSIDKTPPVVTAVTRLPGAGARSAADQVTFRVTFNQDVTGVDAADFRVAALEGLTGAQIVSITPQSPTAGTGATDTFNVVVSTGTGNGTLQLQLIDNDTIINALKVKLNGNADGSFQNGQSYTIDKTPPIVSSIVRTGESQTNGASVSYTVTFSQDVQKVDTNDFTLTTTGVKGATITGVTPVVGNAKAYTVQVNTGSGDGTIALNLKDNDSIINSLGVKLGGTGLVNGDFFTGETYTLIKSAPVVTGITPINPNPTAASTVNYSVTFNQDVEGVDATDFVLSGSGVTGAAIADVTGGGKTYNVTVNTGSGSGSIGLNLIDNDSIKNKVNTALGGSGNGNGTFFGKTYSITKAPPRVTAINRLNSTSSNSASLNFAVLFNETVNRVDAADFSLVPQGITGASITSVTRVNGSYYTVNVNTGKGDGTLGLNLADNDSILNNLGLPLGGNGSNGGFVGEVYTIDKTTPTVDIIAVSPNPRSDKVDSLTLQFSEAIKGLDLGDLSLEREGQPIALDKASLTSSDGITWTLGNVKRLTNERGDYQLSLAAGDTGITDMAGNPLLQNVSDRWTNLTTVEVFEPGITRKGSKGKDDLVGSDGCDVLIGKDGDDVLVGLDCQDKMAGDRGNDTLTGGGGGDIIRGGAGDDVITGGLGADRIKGGAGGDRIVYTGANQATAFDDSLVDAIDHLKGFDVSQGDRIRLDYDNNPSTTNRPSGLFNAGAVKGGSLESAVKSAYRDKNQRRGKAQALQENEAVFFTWKGQVYLSVNNSNNVFNSDGDLVVGLSKTALNLGSEQAGILSVKTYFA